MSIRKNYKTHAVVSGAVMIMAFAFNWVAPDKTLILVEAIERMADDCKAVDATVTPYKVDKVFWLICSGYYYKEKPEVRIKGQKKELIDFLKSSV